MGGGVRWRRKGEEDITYKLARGVHAGSVRVREVYIKREGPQKNARCTHDGRGAEHLDTTSTKVSGGAAPRTCFRQVRVRRVQGRRHRQTHLDTNDARGRRSGQKWQSNAKHRGNESEAAHAGEELSKHTHAHTSCHTHTHTHAHTPAATHTQPHTQHHAHTATHTHTMPRITETHSNVQLTRGAVRSGEGAVLAAVLVAEEPAPAPLSPYLTN